MSAGNVMASKGFTLIELLVTLAVAIILATTVVPNFQSLISSSRLSADYNQVLSGLHYARSEAVKRREPITVTMSEDGGAWSLQVLKNSDLLRRLDGRDAEVAVTTGNIVFNALGRRADCDGDLSDCLLAIEHANGSSRNIRVDATGRIRGHDDA